MDFPFSRGQIRSALSPTASAPAEDLGWIRNATPEVVAHLRARMPARRVPAAVLVPLVERTAGWTILLTQRSPALREHAGQISFPGGRIDAADADARAAALREADEEIGLSADKVEFAGYLPDHLVASGFCITPVVGFVNPVHDLRLAAAEVHDAFEVPLEFLFDARNHRSHLRRLGELEVETTDIPFGSRTIWGATAAILMSLRGLVLAATEKNR
jgi:8-oxo-dGTP pyrophosphatase MutT (NUDIX family)